MDKPLITALTVSGTGLLMLFAALAFLYGLMYAMTAIIRDRPDVKVSAPAAGADTQAARAMWRAAVVAVALARAERESSPASSPKAEVGISPWGQYHRHRLLGVDPHARTGR